jgi:predicted MFS family arabinose efflux permease
MPISIVVIMGIVVLASFLLLYRNAPNLPQKVQAGEGWARLLSKVPKVGAHIWLTGLCWMWFNAAIISFSTFAPDFFISKGYNIGFAGFLVSLLMWGSLGFSPVIGRLVDKVYNNDIFIGGGGLILSIAIYLVVTSTDYLFPMAVMSVAVALVPAPVFSFVSRVSEPENVGLGFGILSSLSGVGMSFGPYLAGAIRDKTSSYEMSFYFLSILALLVATTAFTLRIMTRRIAQDRDQRAHSLREDLSIES